MTRSGVLLDDDFHPDEPDVRRFVVPRSGVLTDGDALVYQVRTDDVVLRHFAWTDRWYKLNVTYDPAGTLVAPGPTSPPFAVNCDIATPMARRDADLSAVDLFIDVLVEPDLHTYRVIDLDEFEHAIHAGLISSHEARQAEAALVGFEAFVTSGDLASLLAEIPPHVSRDAPEAPPMQRVPLAAVPHVQPHRRVTWVP